MTHSVPTRRSSDLAQSTLSQQLRALEDRLGVALIERRTSGAELTPIRGCLRGCLSDDCRPDSDRGSPSDRVTACRCGGNDSLGLLLRARNRIGRQSRLRLDWLSRTGPLWWLFPLTAAMSDRIEPARCSSRQIGRATV